MNEGSRNYKILKKTKNKKHLGKYNKKKKRSKEGNLKHC